MTACGGGDDPPPKLVDVTVTQNGDFTAGLKVRYEPYSTPRLAELAAREGLASVVAGANDEFDAILKLKEWTAQQFPHSTPDPYPPWDAMTVLDWIRGGITGGFCAQYSQVFLQSAAALGMQARYVEIGLDNNPYAHYVLEIWSNQFNKWIVIDVDYNMHFERNGIPLSALEVHQALVRDELANVVSVSGAYRVGHESPSRWPKQLAELYYYLRVHLKANHLSAPTEPPFDRFNDMVEYTDYSTVPWEFSSVSSSYRKEPLTRIRSGDPAEFEAKLNQTRIEVKSFDFTKATLMLTQNFFEFDHFEYRIVDTAGVGTPWTRVAQDSIVWTPDPSKTWLQVRGVNTRGVAGPIAIARARFD